MSDKWQPTLTDLIEAHEKDLSAEFKVEKIKREIAELERSLSPAKHYAATKRYMLNHLLEYASEGNKASFARYLEQHGL